jgi:hypothetical protein
LIVVSIGKKHKNKNTQQPKEADKEKGYETPEIRGSSKTARSQHVREMMLPLPQARRDLSPLWKDFSKPGYERPFMHGVVGPQWNIPAAEVTDGFDIIGSPMPKPDLKTRIIANNYPDKTYTQTSFDLPKRQDVVQTTIPSMTTRTVEESNDPRNPKKRLVKTVDGPVYHNTGSTDPKNLMGSHHSFIEKSGKKNRKNLSKSKKNRRDPNHEARNLRIEGLHHAKQAYETSGVMLDSINAESKMILDAKSANKHEHPEIKLYQENKHLQKRINDMRRTLHGVKAAHTLRRMG